MRSLTCVGFVGFLLLSAGVAQAATIIDFEDWTGGNGQQWAVESRGYVFYGTLFVGPVAGTNNPTNALQDTFKTWPVATAAEPFTIISLDLQEGSAGTTMIELMGYREGGAQVFETLRLDGLASTFETFYPTGFSELIGLRVHTYDAAGAPSSGMSVDNIVVVPEPLTFSLLSYGAIGLRRRRRVTV